MKKKYNSPHCNITLIEYDCLCTSDNVGEVHDNWNAWIPN